MRDSSGLTLIEVILAMAVFSLMLLVVVGGFINVVRLQQSGQASRDTQQNGRFAIEEVMRDSRSASSAVVSPDNGGGNPDTLCLLTNSGIIRYRVDSNRMVRAQTPVIPPSLPQLAAVCNAMDPVASPDRPLTSGGVRVVDFQVGIVQEPPSPTVNPVPTVDVSLTVASADPTLFNPGTNNCNPSIIGSQFCSVTTLRSAATLRGIQ
jgi:prepilin-type N-terminal cleavage/methylation domain-containing protein